MHDEDYPITPGLLALLTQKVSNGYNDEDSMYKSVLYFRCTISTLI